METALMLNSLPFVLANAVLPAVGLFSESENV